ncbi:MAG TPA: cytochrome P450 [Pseudonocardiaceae bacterium]|nr:cytochrome P450 [Pseudonocardiaceae bacterium]
MTSASPFTETTGPARRAAFDELAAGGPAQKITLFTGVPAWLITGYAEVRQVLLDPNVVKSVNETPHRDHVPDWLRAAMNTHMLSSNPPQHTRLRKLVTAAFTRRRVEGLEARITEISDELLAALPRDGSPVDLVESYSYPLPITVISELLGVPLDQREKFRELTTVALSGPVYSPQEYIAASSEMVAQIRSMIEAKRAQPANDLLTGLIEAHDGGDSLTEDELTSMVFLLVAAGHQTTVNLITLAAYTLLTHPEQLAKLRADPTLVPRAVEEVLRYEPPTMVAIPSQTAGPVQVGDVTIPAGEVVVPVLWSANNDPARFERPDEFDITRADIAHVGFGHGIHHCLGAPLARLEAQVALRHLITRLPELRLAEPAHDVERNVSLLLNGFGRLLVETT